jgi:hypothetical protein
MYAKDHLYFDGTGYSFDSKSLPLIASTPSYRDRQGSNRHSPLPPRKFTLSKSGSAVFSLWVADRRRIE